MKKRTWIITAIIAAVALLIIIRTLTSPGPADSVHRAGPSARSGGGKAAVSVYIVKPQPVQDKLIASGTIIADAQVELRCEAAGRIVGLYFRDGSFVKKGALLLKLNDSDLAAQQEKYQASLSLAEEQEKRQKSLFDQQMISGEAYQSFARDLASAWADLDLVRAQIAKTEVRAPFDGAIGLRMIDIGAYVTPGTKIANLVSRASLKIEFSAPERLAGIIAPGNKAAFAVDGSPVRYDAVVSAIEPKIDEASRTLQVRAVCEKPDAHLVPGAFARVEMIIRENEHALMVPSEALIPGATGNRVLVVRDSTIESRPVTTGIRTESSVEIQSGLTEGDAVVVSGILSARPGMKADIMPSGGAPAAERTRPDAQRPVK
jgi:membrane fusion protein (multidrug efflux system)